MSALVWANEVLGLPSSSKSAPLRVHDLPVPPRTLAQAWTAALGDEAISQESQLIVLRALRVSRLLESHDLILPALSPLLLAPATSIRSQAAGALLQYASISSSLDLERHHANLVSNVNLALSPSRLVANGPDSTPSRFVSTCLRILNSVAAKVSPIDRDLVGTLVGTVAHWTYHGPSVGPGPAARVSRANFDSNQLSSHGVLGAFAQTSISPRKRPPGPGRSRASSKERDGTSESESEDGKPDRRVESAQIRLDALACLRSIAKSHNKALRPHWHQFLSDSPYLRNRKTLMTLVESDPVLEVRIQACQTLETMLERSTEYLAIAQDRPLRASFTSLSTKVGETVGELHLAVTSLLSRPSGVATTLRIAILALAERLARCSPYGRMKRSLAGPLATSAVANLTSHDRSVLRASLSLLAAIATRYASTGSKQPVAWDGIVAAVENLAQLPDLGEQVETALCCCLAAMIPIVPERDWLAMESFISRGFETLSPLSQVGRIRVLLAFLPPAATPTSESAAPPLPSTFARLVSVLESGLRSTFPASRALAVSCLAHPSLRNVAGLEPLWWASQLAHEDEDETVSLAGRKVLGLLLRDDPINATASRRAVVSGVINAFLAYQDEDNCWALANACDALTTQDVKDFDFQALHDRVLILLTDSEESEPTRTSCIRIFGSLLKFSRTLFGPGEVDGAIVEILETFQEVLDSTDSTAKLRWNICTALSNAVPSLGREVLFDCLAFEGLFDRVAELVSTDPSYKVRIHAISVLSAMIERSRRPAGEANEDGDCDLRRDESEDGQDEGSRGASRRKIVDPAALSACAAEVKSELDKELELGQVPARERSHVEVLIQKLEALIESTT